MTRSLGSGFTLALGGGGALGYAHIGAIEALAERGLQPGRVVGTSMGAVIGAGLAAGMSPRQMVALARKVNPWLMALKRTRLALLDHRPLMEAIAAEIGDPRIEDLPMPYGAAAYDLVSGRHVLITRGPVSQGLMRSCAINLVFPPIVERNAIWADGGLWEPVPVSLARAFSPERVVAVNVIWSKPVIFERGPVPWSLRLGARWLGSAPNGTLLSARRYVALMAERFAEPVIRAPADLLIEPNMRGVSWLRFDEVTKPRRRGYEATVRALAGMDVVSGPAAGEAQPVGAERSA